MCPAIQNKDHRNAVIAGISLIVVVLALSVLVLGYSSADDSDASDGYEFEVDHLKYRVISEDQKTAELFGWMPLMDTDEVTIPSTVTTTIESTEHTYDVVKIKNSAFNGCTSIVSVSIGNKVVSIEDSAFYGCYSLRTVRLGTAVNTIGTLAFGNCLRLVEVCNDSGLTLTKGDYGYGAVALHAVNIRTSVEPSILKTYDLGEQGRIVYYSTMLDGTMIVSMDDIGQSVTLPDKLNYRDYGIMDYAFYSFTTVRSITFGSGILTVGESSFALCSQLQSVTFSNDLVSIGSNAFSGCSSLGSVSIPDSVLDLGYNAFNNCIALTDLTIGKGLTYIVDGTFSGCSSLTAFVCTDDLTYIGSRAFENCTSLSHLVIGKGIDTIMNSAFSGCANLKGSPSDIRVGSLATTVPALGISAFPAGTCITVPVSMLDAYKTQWAEYKDTIFPDTFSVVFMNGSAVFSSYSAHYGDAVTLPATQPTKESTDKYDYTFKGWSGYTEGMIVTGNMQFNAEYNEIPKEVPPSSGGSSSTAIIVVVLMIIGFAALGVGVLIIKKRSQR